MEQLNILKKHIEKFKDEIKKTKNIDELMSTCLKYCARDTDQEMEQLIKEEGDELEYFFKKRYYLFVEDSKENPAVVAVNKITEKPFASFKMLDDYESIKKTLLMIEGKSVFSLGGITSWQRFR